MSDIAVSASAVSADGVASVHVSGELDIESIGEFHAAIQRCLDAPNCKRVRVDMAGVTFCDSTGVGALVAAQANCVHNGADFSIELLDDRVRRIIELAGLLSALNIES
jgi:anti-anti-sigma factor